MIRGIRKKKTLRRGNAILVTHASAKRAAKWCSGEIVQEYKDDRTEEPELLIKFKQGGKEKQVATNEYLVYFGGEFFAVTYDRFQKRFEFTTGEGRVL